MEIPYRQIRAAWSADTITVYQAYSPAVAEPAVKAGRFVAPFKRERMTWVKPSFLWMMYRSGWATKPGQERVLAVELTRTGFERALSQACLSHFDRDLHADSRSWSRALKSSSVRVQWDPERSLDLGPLPYRSLQVGISGDAVHSYVDEWIVGVTDVTKAVESVHHSILNGDLTGARAQLPTETPYPLPEEIGVLIGASRG